MKITDIENQMLLDFYQAWDRCRLANNASLPNKNQLGLPELGALASHTMLYALTAADKLFIMRSGSIVDEWWSRNMSGILVSDMLSPKTCEDTVRFHKRLITETSAGYAHEWLSHVSGARIECLSLVLPLISKNERYVGYTMSISSLKSKDFSGDLDGVYQQLASRKLVDLQYFKLS